MSIAKLENPAPQVHSHDPVALRPGQLLANAGVKPLKAIPTATVTQAKPCRQAIATSASQGSVAYLQATLISLQPDARLDARVAGLPQR
jgi:hypothetical protein